MNTQTNRFPNVFVQGLNLAKNRPTSLIWTEYTLRLITYRKIIAKNAKKPSVVRRKRHALILITLYVTTALCNRLGNSIKLLKSLLHMKKNASFYYSENDWNL